MRLRQPLYYTTKPQLSYQFIRAWSTPIYTRNAIENATPRMLENKEVVTALAPLDVAVADADPPLLVRLPELLFPVAVGVAPDAPDDGAAVTVAIAAYKSEL